MPIIVFRATQNSDRMTNWLLLNIPSHFSTKLNGPIQGSINSYLIKMWSLHHNITLRIHVKASNWLDKHTTNTGIICQTATLALSKSNKIIQIHLSSKPHLPIFFPLLLTTLLCLHLRSQRRSWSGPWSTKCIRTSLLIRLLWCWHCQERSKKHSRFWPLSSVSDSEPQISSWR